MLEDCRTRVDRPIGIDVASHEPDQPALPFEPPLEPVGVRGPDGALNEVSFDRFAVLLFQEVVRRSAAFDRRDRQHSRSAA